MGIMSGYLGEHKRPQCDDRIKDYFCFAFCLLRFMYSRMYSLYCSWFFSRHLLLYSTCPALSESLEGFSGSTGTILVGSGLGRFSGDLVGLGSSGQICGSRCQWLTPHNGHLGADIITPVRLDVRLDSVRLDKITQQSI